MNHREAWANLDAFLDGELAAPERWAISSHLNTCAACRAYIANLAEFRRVVREHLADVPVPPGLPDRLKAAIAAKSVPPPSKPIPLRTLPVPLRLVALLVPAFVGLWLLARLLMPGT